MGVMSNNPMVYVKRYSSEGEVVIAICDAEILGTTLKDNNIKFYVDPAFYKGELVTLEKALRILSEATIANLIGNNIVEAAIQHGFIHPDAVIVINGVKHAQFAVLGGGNA